MNKQELIKQIKKLFVFGLKDYIERDEVLVLVEQLDEPKKVVIPQFVADWYEKHKDNLEYDIWEYVLHWGKQQKSEFYEWMNYASNKPFQTLANMHQFGYEAEKEKKYKITLLNRNDGDLYLINQNAGVSDKYGHFSPVVLLFTKGTDFSEQCYKLTKKEVASHDFGWVFDCPGIKIEEVAE